METLGQYYQRHLDYLNPEIAQLFISNTIGMELLPELVYGLDHLDEIVRSTHFKTNRILETHDTYRVRAEVNRVFNNCKLHKGDRTWKIKSVGHDTWEAIGGFLKADYVNTFYKVMRAMDNNKLELTLGSSLWRYKLNLEIKTPHPMFAVLEYVDVAESKVLKLPFFLNRLAKSLPYFHTRRPLQPIAI